MRLFLALSLLPGIFLTLSLRVCRRILRGDLQKKLHEIRNPKIIDITAYEKVSEKLPPAR